MRSICAVLAPGRARPNRKQSTVAENKAENQKATENVVKTELLPKTLTPQNKHKSGRAEGNEMFQDIMEICVCVCVCVSFVSAGPSSSQRWPNLTIRSVNAHICGHLERAILPVLLGHEYTIVQKSTEHGYQH